MPKTRSSESLTLGVLLSDQRLLIILFIALRGLLMLVYQPILAQDTERGMTAGGDLTYYFQLASLSGQGYAPFVGWWSEFPPVPAFLITGIYQLLGANANYSSFAMLFSFLMLACDVGNLLLVRSIGTKLHGVNTGMALAWIYALLCVPIVFINWNFEPLVALFLLLSINALLAKKDTQSAIWAGVGALTKFTPAILLGAVWRFRETKRAIRYTAICVAIFAVVYGLLFAQNAAMTAPSLTAQFNKASYQTVWALLDGNYRTGNFGSSLERLDPANAYIMQGNPSVVSGVVRLAVAGLIGLFVFWRTRRFDDKGLVAFVTIALLIFFLQAQGWSPQWLAQIIPLILLCFPSRDGILVIVLLSLVTFAEYPFLFIRTGDTGGTISGGLVAPFVALVLSRTLILVGVCVALYQRLRQHPVTGLSG